MATSLNHSSINEYNCKVSYKLTGTTGRSHSMEVKGRLITAMGLPAPEPQSCRDSKQQAARLLELQERKRSLQSLLESRLAELRRVCLLEAEMTGELPSEFPLEAGERPPLVRTIMGKAHSVAMQNSKEEEEVSQRMPKKGLFSGALLRQKEPEQHHSHSKRMVHRGCHTDEVVKTESTPVLNTMGQDNGESSPSSTQNHLSPSRPRPAQGSPDKRLGRKPSPVEIYYEMRNRRSSVASSASPSHSLPRSTSNMEGRSVPATPLLSRTAITGIHWRSEVLGGPTAEQSSDSFDFPQLVPLQDGSSPGSFDRGGCPGSGTQARRSNSSEALLDRSAFPEDGGRRTGMPPRGGPYKSSETLTDGRLRYVLRGSPERHPGEPPGEQGRMRSSVGGRAGGGGYNAVLMDYIWGKQQKIQVHQYPLWQHPSTTGGNSKIQTEGHPSPISSATILTQFPDPPPSQSPTGPPAHSPLMLRSKLGEFRRVTVTRTKSCGPFFPPQPLGAILLPGHPEPPHGTAVSASSSAATLYPYQPEQTAAPLACRPSHFPNPGPEDSARNLHKALALEGLRDWYLRNALGYAAPSSKEPEAGLHRRPHHPLHSSHPHPLTHQPQSVQGDHPYLHFHTPQMTLSASFHGHPLHSRSMELSLYHDLAVKDSSADSPAPGTLV
ncbi:coiled-coil domain-containing protein 120 isoform X2 [Scleropages formosus]|uniref:coiled-coil domain-containing protein 120 isoform X2 n=1 Tax=Scleropages formosus TaxID=113540 RepID=UPI0010FAC2E9|nr:coiled-coil domain-containing protein 120-like isoform X2 [Scleropages formosus]